MARFGDVWGEQGCTGRTGAINSERGVLMGVDGVVNDVAGVWDLGGSETYRFRGFWCELGGGSGLWGCSAGFTFVRHCFPAVARGPGWGKAWSSAVVDDDVAVAQGGSRFGVGVRGASRGGLGCVGRLLDRC
jgi:hypothetical protein